MATKQERESERVRQEAIESLGNWNDRDPWSFEQEQRRIYNDLVNKGLKI